MNCKGFTLIEIAIVLIIIGILLAGGIPIFRATLEQKKRNETIAYIEEAKEAIKSYVKIYGRFPYADSDGDGKEDIGSRSGNLPYVTLRIKPVDSYSRHLKYEVNRSLTKDRFNTCRSIKNGISGYPKVVDSDAGKDAFSVAAVILSAGKMDADRDGSPFDKLQKDGFQGDNTDGRPNYIRYPPTDDFDDILRYISPYEIYGQICEFVSLAVNNSSALPVYVFNATEMTDLGKVPPKSNRLYEVLSGTKIEIRNKSHGGGKIVNSDPMTPIIISGRGLTINISSSSQKSLSGYKVEKELRLLPIRRLRLR